MASQQASHKSHCSALWADLVGLQQALDKGILHSRTHRHAPLPELSHQRSLQPAVNAHDLHGLAAHRCWPAMVMQQLTPKRRTTEAS